MANDLPNDLESFPIIGGALGLSYVESWRFAKAGKFGPAYRPPGCRWNRYSIAEAQRLTGRTIAPEALVAARVKRRRTPAGIYAAKAAAPQVVHVPAPAVYTLEGVDRWLRQCNTYELRQVFRAVIERLLSHHIPYRNATARELAAEIKAASLRQPF